MAKYGISPFDNDSATFAHSEIYYPALKNITCQMEALAETGQLEESMLGHMFVMAIDLARFPMEQHNFTKKMNDDWQDLLKNYVRENDIESERLAKTLDFILALYFFRNEPDGYIQGFKTIARADFPDRRYFISLVIDDYFDGILNMLSAYFEDGLEDLLPDRDTILAYLDLYVSWAREVPEEAKGRMTASQFKEWKAAYYAWFADINRKVPKKFRTIMKINMDELFEEFEYYAV